MQVWIDWAAGAVSDVIVEVHGYDGSNEDENPSFRFLFEAGSGEDVFSEVVGGPFKQLRVYAKLSSSDDDNDTEIKIRPYEVQTRIADA
jgi:hypothetical protein